VGVTRGMERANGGQGARNWPDKNQVQEKVTKKEKLDKMFKWLGERRQRLGPSVREKEGKPEFSAPR